MKIFNKKIIICVLLTAVVIQTIGFTEIALAQDEGSVAAGTSATAATSLATYCAKAIALGHAQEAIPGTNVPSLSVPVNTDTQLKIQLGNLTEAICTIGMTQAGQKAIDQGNQMKESWWKLIVRIIIKRILDKIVAQTVQWIQGGGTPRFVTNWEDLIVNSANESFGDVLRVFGHANLCYPPNIQVTQYLTAPPLQQGVSCTFTGAAASYQAWVKNFQNGGWYSWQQFWQPNNNPYGNLLLAWDARDRQTALKATSRQNESVANQGIFSIKECVRKKTLYDFNSNPYSFCTRYETVTPGRFVGDEVSRALTSHIDFLVSSQDLNSAIASIIDAALNRLIREGLSLMKPGPSSPPPPVPSTWSAEATASATAAIAQAEAQIAADQAANQAQLEGSIAAASGGIGVPPVPLPSPPSTSTSSSNLQTLLNILTKDASTTQSLINTLSTLIGCESTQYPSTSTIPLNQGKLNSANSSLTIINSLINQINSGNYPDYPNDVNSAIQEYSADLTQKQSTLTSAQADLQSCLSTLPK